MITGIGIAIGLWLANSPYDLLPIIASIIGTVSIFLLKGIQMRIGFLIGAVLWLINNIMVGSIGGVMLESTLLCINLFTIYSLYKKPQLQTELDK